MAIRGVRWLVWTAKYGAWCIVLAYIALPIYDALVPWPIAEAQLAQFTGDRHFMVGFRISRRYDHVANTTTDLKSRSYFLVPSVLRDPKIVIVSEIEERGVSLTKRRFGFLYHAFWFVAGLLAIWRLRSRDKSTKGSRINQPSITGLKQEQSNGSGESKAAAHIRWYQHQNPWWVTIIAALITLLLLIVTGNPFWWLASLVLFPLMAICFVALRLTRRRN